MNIPFKYYFFNFFKNNLMLFKSYFDFAHKNIFRCNYLNPIKKYSCVFINE